MRSLPLLCGGLFFLLPVLLLSACAPQSLVPGDRVVARWKGDFWEATVLEVKGKLVTVAWDTGPPEKSYLPRGWVVKAGAKPDGAKPNDVLLCPLADRWTPCRLEQLGAEAWEVSLNGEAHALDPTELLPVPAEVAAWADREVRRRERRADVARTLAGAVPATAGSVVEPAAEVLARWTDGHWYRATVFAAGEDAVTVRWAGGSGAQEVPAQSVAPLKRGAALAVGQAALCHWAAGGASGRYWPAIVSGRSATGLRVEWENGTGSQVAMGDCEPVKAR